MGRLSVIFIGFMGLVWAGGEESAPVGEHARNRVQRPLRRMEAFYYPLRDSGEVGPDRRLWEAVLGAHIIASPVSTSSDSSPSVEEMPLEGYYFIPQQKQASIGKLVYPPLSSTDPLLFAARAEYLTRRWGVWELNEQAFQAWYQVPSAHQLLQDAVRALSHPGQLKGKAYRTLRTRIRAHLQSDGWTRDIRFKTQDDEKLRCLWLLLGRKRGEDLIGRLGSQDFP